MTRSFSSSTWCCCWAAPSPLAGSGGACWPQRGCAASGRASFSMPTNRWAAPRGASPQGGRGRGWNVRGRVPAGALEWERCSPIWGPSGYAQGCSRVCSLHLSHTVDLGMTGIKSQWLCVTWEGVFLIRVVNGLLWLWSGRYWCL